MRVVIVDDEPVARRGLRQLLRSCPDITVVGEAGNGAEAVRVISSVAPDLVLLDVQMPGGDGFDVLRRLVPPLPAIIFVTAYDEYAVPAFETHALDYVMKPVNAARFSAAVERARERMRSAAAVDEARRLLQLLGEDRSRALEASKAPTQRLMVSNGLGEQILDAADVDWIEANNYYAVLHCRGSRHLLRESLDSLGRRLDPRRFVRAHRSAIVNLSAIREFRRLDEEPRLLLADGTTVPVSRRRRAMIAEAIRRFALAEPSR
jgi:two-component system LytT family response regulator